MRFNQPWFGLKDEFDFSDSVSCYSCDTLGLIPLTGISFSIFFVRGYDVKYASSCCWVMLDEIMSDMHLVKYVPLWYGFQKTS